MQETSTKSEKSGVAVKKAEKALEQGFAEVKTSSQAADVLDKIENAAGDVEEKDFAPSQGSSDPIEQAAALDNAAAAASPKERAAAVLTEAAAQIAASPSESRATLDEAVADASGEPSLSAKEEAPQVKRGRTLLREELMRRLRPFDAIDAALFIRINHLPHPSWLDGLIARFSWMMTGGHGFSSFSPTRSASADGQPALHWLCFLPCIFPPIRLRFPSRNIFVAAGRSSQSFAPLLSGANRAAIPFHRATAPRHFAGAALLQTCYPRGRRLFFAIALLVAFSRVYLGAHYPGDVLSGGLAGAALAKLYRSLLRYLR
jgi:hypothetical protein